MKTLEEMTKAELINFAETEGIEFDPTAKKADILAAIRASSPLDIKEVADGKPKIVPSEHAAMCGQATADNHEERIRDLEAAVAHLLNL